MRSDRSDRHQAALPYSAIVGHLRLEAAEAVALALAAAYECDGRGGADIERLRIPAGEHVLLHQDGQVTLTGGAPAVDSERMKALASLLEGLLGLEQSAGSGVRLQVPGALLILLARAFGKIDLPAPSYEELRGALSRFGSSRDLVSRRRVYARWRALNGPIATPGRPTQAVPPMTGGEPAARMPERRHSGPRVSDLRRELRILDRALFEMRLAQRNEPRRHAAAGPVAALSLVIAALFFLMFTGRIGQERTLTSQPDPSAQGPHSSPGVDASALQAQLVSPSVASRRRPFQADTPGSRQGPMPLLASNDFRDDRFSPSFARNGRDVFFHQGRERAALMRASFDEQGRTSVTTVLEDGAANYHAVLSPDGRWLAYDSDRDGTRAVYVGRPDGTDTRKVSGAGYAAVPRWSPDGLRIAFSRSEGDRPRVWNVWIADLDSGSVARVSRHTVGQSWSASWFPDGERVAYTVEDRLVIVDLRSQHTRVERSPISGALVRTAAVSPDGRSVAFQVHRDGVWLLDVMSGTMQRIVADPTAEEFSWSPDGARLVYHSRRQGRWSLWELRFTPAA